MLHPFDRFDRFSRFDRFDRFGRFDRANLTDLANRQHARATGKAVVRPTGPMI